MLPTEHLVPPPLAVVPTPPTQGRSDLPTRRLCPPMSSGQTWPTSRPLERCAWTPGQRAGECPLDVSDPHLFLPGLVSCPLCGWPWASTVGSGPWDVCHTRVSPGAGGERGLDCVLPPHCPPPTSQEALLREGGICGVLGSRAPSCSLEPFGRAQPFTVLATDSWEQKPSGFCVSFENH